SVNATSRRSTPPLPQAKGKQRKRPAAKQGRRRRPQVRGGGISGGHRWGNLGGRRGTTIDLDAQPHVQEFVINIDESVGHTDPEFVIDEDRMMGMVLWPAELMPASF